MELSLPGAWPEPSLVPLPVSLRRVAPSALPEEQLRDRPTALLRALPPVLRLAVPLELELQVRRGLLHDGLEHSAQPCSGKRGYPVAALLRH